MKSTDHIEAVFHHLVGLSETGRLRWFENEGSQEDPDVLRELRTLLAGHEESSILDDPPELTPAGSGGVEDDELVGTTIGAYQILRILGRGGMGAVC